MLNRLSGPFSSYKAGFSLLELCVVLLIVSLFLSGISFAFKDQLRHRMYEKNRKLLEDAADHLLAWAMVQADAPRLPCPDSGTDGEADVLITDPNVPWRRVCPSSEGWLPWRTLGLPSGDIWGKRIRYRVDQAFSRLENIEADKWTGIRLNQSTLDGIRVCEDVGCQSIIGKNLAAVIISHGQNGYGAPFSSYSGNAKENIVMPPYNNTSERQNINGRVGNAPTKDFVFRPSTQGQNSIEEFDDIIVWLSPLRAVNRLVEAGRIP